MKHKHKVDFISWMFDRFLPSPMQPEMASKFKAEIYSKLKEYDFEEPESDPNQTHITF